MLSSDILEQQFGPTKVVILKQNTDIRIINTVVINTGQVLELSIVKFDKSGAKIYKLVHEQIVAGESIGKAFKSAGIEFIRQTKYQTSCVMPVELQKQFLAEGEATCIEVSIIVGPQKTQYCDIFEVYSPAVKWPKTTEQVINVNSNIKYLLSNLEV